MAFSGAFVKPFRPVFDAGLAAAAVLVPAAGMACWLKGDAITGLRDGDVLTTWTDSSGNSRDLTQSNASYKPKYKISGINGKPSVQFDGSNDHLLFASVAPFVRPFSVFIVLNSTAYPPSDFRHVLGWGSATFSDVVIGIKGDTHIVGGYWPYSWKQSAQTIAPDTTGVLEIVADIASTRLGANGALTTIASGITNSSAGAAVGARLDSGQFQAPVSLNGYIAEIIVYNSALSDANRQTTEVYLNAKYAIY